MNQLPEVRKFVHEKGNSDSYVGLILNFVPHHHPYLIFYDDKGNEQPKDQWTDLAPFTYQQILGLLAERGFKRKDLL